MEDDKTKQRDVAVIAGVASLAAVAGAILGMVFDVRQATDAPYIAPYTKSKTTGEQRARLRELEAKAAKLEKPQPPAPANLSRQQRRHFERLGLGAPPYYRGE